MIAFSQRIFVGLLVSFFLSGCSGTYGAGDRRPADSGVVQKILPGKSTKADVERILGQPRRVTFPDLRRELWTYLYSQAKNYVLFIELNHDGANYKDTNLTVEFDQRGIVRRIGKGEVK